jgi:hypothetical protein
MIMSRVTAGAHRQLERRRPVGRSRDLLSVHWAPPRCLRFAARSAEPGLSFGLIHPRPGPFTGERQPSVRPGQVHSRPVVDGIAQSSKACEGATLRWAQIPTALRLTAISRRQASAPRPAAGPGLKCGLIHRRPEPFTDGRAQRIRARRGRWRLSVNGGQHCWKACWVQALASSNLASSATLTCGDALGSC